MSDPAATGDVLAAVRAARQGELAVDAEAADLELQRVVLTLTFWPFEDGNADLTQIVLATGKDLGADFDWLGSQGFDAEWREKKVLSVDDARRDFLEHFE